MRATHGRVGAWTRVKTTTRTKTSSNIHVVPAAPAVTGTVASTTGTAPRSPAHERNAWVRHGIRNGVHETTTDSGRASSSRAAPMTRAGTSWSANPLGDASSPSSTNSPICASHPSAEAKPVTAGRCGSRRLPRTRAAR